MLGNAIKKLNLPREELVILTKVRNTIMYHWKPVPLTTCLQLYAPVGPEYGSQIVGPPEEFGIINQQGLSRKVGLTVGSLADTC